MIIFKKMVKKKKIFRATRMEETKEISKIISNDRKEIDITEMVKTTRLKKVIVNHHQ